MIEATCSACGALNRVAKASVPAGSRFVTCADCKSRIALPTPPAPAAALPRVPPIIPRPPIAVPPPATPSEVIDLADLPAPKRSPPLGARPGVSPPKLPPVAKPPTRSGLSAALDSELTAPRVVRPAAAASPPSLELEELLAPPGPPEVDAGIDLPAPKKSTPRAAPEPSRREEADLPAPKLRSRPSDLPAPRLTGKGVVLDPLPTPPTGPAPGLLADLPAPKKPPTSADLPAPSQQAVEPQAPSRAGLPDPGSFFDDLPQPARAQDPQLPAPKGFFDDLPQPARAQGPQLPAPKGFFDDLPQPASSPSAGSPRAPAPETLLDDSPGRAHPGSSARAPHGFFEGLPQPTPRTEPSPGGQRTDDLELETGPDLDLTELESAPGHTAPEAPDAFDQLDLSSPSAMPGRPGNASRVPSPPPANEARFHDSVALEIDGARPELVPARPAAQQRPPAQAVAAASMAGSRARRARWLAGGLAALGILGGGGFLLYQRHAAAQQRDAEVTAQLAIARASYAATDAKHWQRAAAAAQKVVALDSRNPEALGIGAESLLASALSDGIAAAQKIGQARAMLDAANSAGLSRPQLARARALATLAARQPDGAIKLLQPLVNAAPQDGVLALYLGWALESRGDAPGAVASYDRAVGDPAVKLAALYGRGSAKLALADLEGARADFSAVLELDKDHIGAQVGLAAAAPPSAAQQQEADLIAILARKDLASADPRAVARAWRLAGAAAVRQGRYDLARERYRKALAVLPQDLAATTGLADTELRDGKLAAAAQLTATALGLAKDDVAAQLVQSEIEIRENKLPLASQRLAALASHPTPLGPLEQARLQLVTGKLLEAQGKDDAAIDAYIAAARAAGDLDLAPTMAAVTKLAAKTAEALAARDLERAEALRARSEVLLGELAGKAERDPHLAMALGMAYLQEDSAEKAELWLRRVVDARPQDPEARFQLGRALSRLGKHEAAREALADALGRTSGRADIGVELARTYEALGNDAEAGALYTQLLAGKDPSLELRGHAGRFFARTGAIDKAGEQGAQIVQADPRNPTGFYLKGEALLAAGKLLEAKQAFQRALEIDRAPHYLDALGRAAEALARSGDRELQDLALRSYLAAAEAAPDLTSALVGQGRLYVARHEAAKAVPPLLSAAKLDPKNAEVMFLIGCAYQELQQASAALQWLEASARGAPSAETFWRIGQLYRDANQGKPAAAALGSATRLAADSEKRSGTAVPWLTDALYLQGRVQLDLHNEAAAREAWQLYVARNPPPSAQLTEVRQLLATTLRR